MLDKELLIECVKEYTFLYDLSDKLYSNAEQKNLAWREIARKVRAPAKECKKIWTLLRDSFRRSIKKQKELEAENDGVVPKKWRYADEMAFLLPYYRYRQSKILADEDDNYIYQDDESLDEAESSIPFTGMKNEKIFTETPAELPQNADDDTTQAYNGKRRRLSSSCERLSLPEEKTAFSTLLHYVMEDRRSADDIQHFFAGITATVRNFPPEDRIIAKAKVFELVTTMELEILNRKDKDYDDSDDENENE